MRGFLGDCDLQPTSSRPQLLAAVKVPLLLSDNRRLKGPRILQGGWAFNFHHPLSTGFSLLSDFQGACAGKSAPKFHS